MTAPVQRIEIHEFQDAAEQFIREIRETGCEIVVTIDGEPVAVIRPYTEEDGESVDFYHDLAVLGRLEKLSEELAKSPGLSAADAVSEQRKPAQSRLVEWPLRPFRRFLTDFALVATM